MTYTWEEYQKAQKIVRTFQNERSSIQQKRFSRQHIYSGFTDTLEQHFEMLWIRIWLRREYLANEMNSLKNPKWKKWDDDVKETYLDGIRAELNKLRYEYFKYKAHGVTRFTTPIDWEIKKRSLPIPG